MVAGPSVMCEFVRPDAVPVVMVHMPTDVLGDDRFSPGVACCVPLDRRSCVDSHGKEHWERLEFDWDSYVACILNGWVHWITLLVCRSGIVFRWHIPQTFWFD